MTRTRTLVIIGCFMLVLAILAALELRSGESVLSEGQTVTGTLSKDSPPSALQPGLSSTPVPGAESAQATLPEGSLPAREPASSAILPLDNGTLRASAPESTPLSPAASTPPSTLTPQTAPDQAATPVAEPAREAARDAATTPPSPVKAVPAQPDPPKEPAAATRTATSTAPVKQDSPQAEATSAVTEQPELKTGGHRIITTRAPEKLQPGESAVTWTHLELEGKQVLFRFTGAGPLDGKGFFLPEPPRYVVDLQGSWGIQLPKVPNNDLLKAIRAGRHEGNTRLVFDLSRPLTNCQVLKANKETLEVRIR